jgi:hypothetical protein
MTVIHIKALLNPEFADNPLMYQRRERVIAGSRFSEIRIGNIVELELEVHPDAVDYKVQEIRNSFSLNPLIETYEIFLLVAQPDNSIRELPISRWEPVFFLTDDNEKIVEPERTLRVIDLTNKWPPIGPYRILRAEWQRPGSLFRTIRFSKDGVEQDDGLVLELSKRVFFNLDYPDRFGRKRTRTLQKLAPEIADFLIRYVHVYGEPIP